MYGGRIVEYGTKEQVLFDPLHPYTRGLIECLPKLNESRRRLIQIEGIMPNLLALPEGCYFSNRCKEVGPDCRIYPEERVVDGRRVSCHRIK
jgi:peptide/nickel transport system ATP-binding protein